MKFTGFSIEDILSKERCSSTLHDDMTSHTPYRASTPDYHHHYQRYFPYPAHRHHYHTHSISPPQPISPDSTLSMSDDLDGDKLSRRPRTSITVCQREFLELEFQKERYPTLAYIDKLSRKVHLQQYVIKVWFQNRRAKYRKEGHRRKPTTSSSPVPDNKTGTDLLDDKYNNIENKITSQYKNNNKKIELCTTSSYSSKYDNRFHDKYTSPERKLFTSSDRCSLSSYPWQRTSKLDTSCVSGKSQCRCLMCRENTTLLQY